MPDPDDAAALDEDGIPDLAGPLAQKAATGDPQEGVPPPSDRPVSFDWGVTEAEAGLLVPGFLAQDAYNLVVGLPILLASLWLARRGSFIGLLLWPGALFYMLYTYALYLVGAPFSALFV